MTALTYATSDLNQLSQAQFVALLGPIFEETPAIAQKTWTYRPFTSRLDLHRKMVAIVEAMPPAEQLALIQAHPELATRSKMAANSVQEQASTGLNQLEPCEHERFQALNKAYLEKFGFPFVMAVKGQDKASILAAFEGRLGNEREEEMARSLQEISKIADFRLQALIPAE